MKDSIVPNIVIESLKMFNIKCFFGWHKFQLIEEKYREQAKKLSENSDG